MRKYEIVADLMLQVFRLRRYKTEKAKSSFSRKIFGQFYINNTRCHSDERSEEESREHPLYSVENFRSG